MEWWTFAASQSDVRQEDYPSEPRYKLAKQNTWEFPRFCFSFFRPRPDAFAALLAAMNQYQGQVAWSMHDNCIGAFPSRPGFINHTESVESLKYALANPPKADPEFVKRAVADIPTFCKYLEAALGLKEKGPVDFDPEWLTRDGLARSKGPFEDFLERGPWTAILTPNPDSFDMTAPSRPGNQILSFSIGMSERDALFKELGADWGNFQHGDGLQVLPHYPLLSQLDDISGDAAYQATEIETLLAECLKADKLVTDPAAVRGLDKLIRIARWAQKINSGVYFVGQ
jgi:hypothetical protein